MAQIIERIEDASDQPPFVFSVYLSPKDKTTVLGYLVPYGIAGDQKVTWIKTDFGVPVEKAFRTVLELAEQYGMPFVLIQDPGNLFPASNRGV